MAAVAQPENSIFSKIIIVGGGISGLSAASHLVKCGHTDFLLLEATEKLGGRIDAAETCNFF